MDAHDRYERLLDEPPSAKLVYKVLELDAPLTHGEIASAAVLPDRTVSYALSRLREADIVEDAPCPQDPRKRNYHPLPIEDDATASDPDAASTDAAVAPEQPSD